MNKIKTVGPVSEFPTKFGTMKKYSLQFEGSDDWVNLNQKPESPAPTVGQELEGTIEDSQFGKQFKKATQASGAFGAPKATDPATRASIEAQTSLNAAVTAVRDYYPFASEDELKGMKLSGYIGKIIQVSKLFASSLAGSAVTAPDPVATVQKVMPGAEAADDKPPVDAYDQASTSDIDLNTLPF
jgi:hypothetical protein